MIIKFVSNTFSNSTIQILIIGRVNYRALARDCMSIGHISLTEEVVWAGNTVQQSSTCLASIRPGFNSQHRGQKIEGLVLNERSKFLTC